LLTAGIEDGLRASNWSTARRGRTALTQQAIDTVLAIPTVRDRALGAKPFAFTSHPDGSIVALATR